MRTLSVMAVQAAVMLAAIGLWALPNRPHALEPPPGGKLQSVSFAPFRDGQSPLTGVYPTRAEIDQDLQRISGEVFAVRTYTSREGLEAVPELAQRLGLKVLQGAWIGGRPEINDQEIASLIHLANTWPDTVTRVIVGNEVLLRGDQTPDQLIQYIRRVKAAVKQPVTYADVWEWWLRHPEIADEVDFITIHLLPYWEDDPAGIDDVDHRIEAAWARIHKRFPTKPILVGEAGWPTAGRTRGPAVPSLVNNARFITGFIRLAARDGFDYNLIEAFDQPWKAANEGTVGANWGLETIDRVPKYDLQGPVSEDADWGHHATVSVILGLVFLVIATTGRRILGPLRLGMVAALSQGLAAALVQAALFAGISYFPFDGSFSGALLTLQALLTLAVLRACVPGRDAPRPPPSLVAVLTGFGKTGRLLAGNGVIAYGVLSVLAIALNLLLVADGRYRDFPVHDFAAPALGILGLAVLRLTTRGKAAPSACLAIGGLLDPAWPYPPPAPDRRPDIGAEASLATLLGLGAVAVLISEGTENREALAWAAIQLILCVPYAASVWAAWRGRLRGVEA
jgi:exo-beta-1,3-glucanase (GH17 family)